MSREFREKIRISINIEENVINDILATDEYGDVSARDFKENLSESVYDFGKFSKSGLILYDEAENKFIANYNKTSKLYDISDTKKDDAENAGTRIRKIFNKLLYMSEETKKLVDFDFFKNKDKFKGYILSSSEQIVNMLVLEAKEGLEIISLLITENILSYETLVSIFGEEDIDSAKKIMLNINGDLDRLQMEMIDRMNFITNLNYCVNFINEMLEYKIIEIEGE